MKFDSLKEFWEWLTISTGDYGIDFKSLVAYLNSPDYYLLTHNQKMIFETFYNSIHIIDLESKNLN
jgi:hypothetical protein